MREIKLRAWDKKNNCWAKITLDDWVSSDMTARITGAKVLEIDDDDRYTWQQFTGLKDKNGKEIYEKDILEDEKKTIYTVIYEDASFWRQNEEDKDCDELTNFVDSPELEVIGNIYENPELLKSN